MVLNMGNKIDLVLHRGSLGRVARASIWNAFGGGVSAIGTILSSFVLLRVLGLSGYGGVAIVLSTITIVIGFAGLGLGVVITRFVAHYREKNPQRAESHLSSEIIFSGLSGALFSLAILFLGSWLAESVLGHHSLTVLLRIGAPLVFFGTLTNAGFAGLSGLHEFRLLGILKGLRGFLDAILMIVGCLLGNSIGAMVGFCIAEAISCLLITAFVFRRAPSQNISVSPRIDRRIIREAVRFAVPVYLTSSLINFATWFVLLLLAHQPGGLEAVGVFNLATRFYLLILFAPTILSTLYFPILTSLASMNRKIEYKDTLITFISVSLIVTAISAAGISLFMPTLLRLFAPHHQRIIVTLWVLALASVFSALNTVLSSIAISIGKVWWWFVSDFVLAVAMILTGDLLVTRDLAVGVAWSYVMAYLASCIAIMPALRDLRGRHGEGALLSASIE